MSTHEHIVPIRTSAVRAVLAWWLAARRACPIPRRRQLDPVAFSKALSFVWFARWEAGRDCFVYCLAGEEINLVFGRSIAGKTPEDLYDAEAVRRIRGTWRRVLGEPAVCHQTGHVLRDAGTSVKGERLLLPLSDDGQSPCYVLGVTYYRLPKSTVQVEVDDFAALFTLEERFYPLESPALAEILEPSAP